MIRASQARAARKRYREMVPVLNEQSRRRFVVLEAQALGRGGVSLMARISRLARSTIYRGLSDIRDNALVRSGRVRREGGGRKEEVIPGSYPCGRPQEVGRARDAGRPDAATVVDDPQLA